MRRFKNKTILVTGSSRGIGRAIAIKFAEEGGNVIINYRKRREKALETERMAKEYNVETLVVGGDLSKEENVKGIFGEIKDAFGGLDILVNNAGLGIASPAVFMEESLWNKIMDFNLKTAFLCSKYAIPLMMEKNWGRIINVTSIAGIHGMKFLAHYSAAKAGLIALTKTLAAEVYQNNITVNAVAAGLTRTDMGMSIFKMAKQFFGYQEDIEELASKWAKKHTLIGRLIEPWEVARAVLFLADPESSAITGQVIIVDGGQYLVETARYDEL